MKLFGSTIKVNVDSTLIDYRSVRSSLLTSRRFIGSRNTSRFISTRYNSLPTKPRICTTKRATDNGIASDTRYSTPDSTMSDEWYARPVLFVTDIDRSVDFYVKQLGFNQQWRYEEEGKAFVAQVGRRGCELILSSQWPDKA